MRAYIEKEIMTHWRFFYVIKRAVSIEKEEKDERKKKDEDKQTNSFPFHRSIESIHPYYLMDWLVFIVPNQEVLDSKLRGRERDRKRDDNIYTDARRFSSCSFFLRGKTNNKLEKLTNNDDDKERESE